MQRLWLSVEVVVTSLIVSDAQLLIVPVYHLAFVEHLEGDLLLGHEQGVPVASGIGTQSVRCPI